MYDRYCDLREGSPAIMSKHTSRAVFVLHDLYHLLHSRASCITQLTCTMWETWARSMSAIGKLAAQLKDCRMRDVECQRHLQGS